MSCLKIIFILTNFFLVITLPIANSLQAYIVYGNMKLLSNFYTKQLSVCRKTNVWMNIFSSTEHNCLLGRKALILLSQIEEKKMFLVFPVAAEIATFTFNFHCQYKSYD